MSPNPDLANGILLKFNFIGLSTSSYRQYFASIGFKGWEGVPIPPEIHTWHLQVGNIPVKLILVLTDCSEFYNKFRPQSYRGASGAVIFFDKSDRQSFDNVPQWLEEFRKFIPSVTSPTYKIPKQLIDPPNVDKPVGLAGISIKPSMHRNPEIVVPLEEAQSLADQLSLPYYDSPFPASRKKFKHFLISLAHQVIE